MAINSVRSPNQNNLQVNGFISQPIGSALTSGTTVTPTGPVHHVTAANAINTITVPTWLASLGGTICFIPDGAYTLGTSGNIAIASTATVGRAMFLTYDPTAVKWYPSY